MVMSGYYGPVDDETSKSTIREAVDAGLTWIDTADSYGVGHNESLLGSVLGPVREEVFLGTKFGLVHQGLPGRQLRINGRPDYARRALAASLKRLGTDWLDLYYLHRVDPGIPVEETVGAMSEFVEAGLVRYLGICEAEPEEIRRANAVHPLLAVQTEYSLMSREPEGAILDTVRELGISFVPYGPVGRGLLTGAVSGLDDVGPDDQRHRYPRWQGVAFEANLHLAQKYLALCASWGLSGAEVAISWTRQRDQSVRPVPGTRSAAHARQNLAAARLDLTAEQRAALEGLFRPGAVAGMRWPAEGAAVKLPWSATGSNPERHPTGSS